MEFHHPHELEEMTNDCVMTFTIEGQRISDSPQRIAACYNACRGLNPEVVPELVGGLQEIADDLLKQLEGPYNKADQAVIGDVLRKARKLLAKVKG